MLNQFLNYFQSELSISKDAKVLIAISGGIDSMVLFHLCRAAGNTVGLAHVNFKLRGKESDADELFLKMAAKKTSTPFYTTSFETEKIAKQKKLSIQETARNLRYEWLEKIRIKNGYDFLATAHHLNDSIETALYNFAKGTGIRGLTGIPPKRDHIIRPLLFASKEEIKKYAASFEINYREDASNASDKYARNLIRHEVIPPLQHINPSLEKTAKKNFEKLKEVQQLFNERIEAIKKEIFVSKNNGDLEINLLELKKHPSQKTILFELIRAFGFNEDQVQQILRTTDTTSGKQFLSPTHRLVVNREQLLITENGTDLVDEIIVNDHHQKINLKEHIVYTDVTNDIPTRFEASTIHLDLEKLSFPLKFRRWKSGDVFQPLGMKGQQQKLKDFFINNKLSLVEKEKIWVLESGKNICWIAGHRIDERFKVTDDTKRCFVLRMERV